MPSLSDALSYVASVIGLLVVKTAFQEQRMQPRDTLGGQILAGLLWLWQQPLVRIATCLTAGNTIVGGGLYLLLVVLAKQGMHAPATLIGAIFTIGAIGGILGSALLPPLQKRLTFGQTVIGLGLVQTLLFPLFALAPHPIVLGMIFAARTVVIAVYNVVLVSYRLALIPDELQGRVNSAVRLISVGSNAVGMVLIGMLLQSVGPRATVVTCCVWLLGLTLVTSASPKVRHAPPLTAGPST